MDMVQRTYREALAAAEGTPVKWKKETWYMSLLKPDQNKPLVEVKKMAAAYPGSFGAKKLMVVQYEAGRLITIQVKYKSEKRSSRQPRGETRRRK